MDKQLYLWRDRALFLGTLPEMAYHAQPADALVLSLTGEPVEFTWPGKSFSAAAAVVPPGVKHSFYALEIPVAVLYLAVERNEPDKLRRCFNLSQYQGLQWLSTAQIAPWREYFATCWQQPASLEQVADQLAQLLSGAYDTALDPRIMQTMQYIQAHPDASHSAPSLAGRVHLSVTRFMHLFKEQFGAPLRRAVIWHRVRSATKYISTGYSLTEAALAAGFSDAAHFSKTFKGLFGMPPSAIFNAEHRLQVYVDVSETEPLSRTANYSAN